MNRSNYDRGHTLFSRRRFVQGMASAGALAAFGGKNRLALGEIAQRKASELSGSHFELTLDTLPVNFTGRDAVATGINGSSPGPTLRWREGDTVTIAVTNRLKMPSSIHWHGMRIPTEMDGVPGLSFRGIAPGETFVYRFPVLQSGTYWYHSHSQFQEQTGLLGSIVIEPREPYPVEFDREYVVLLSDWADADPESIFSNLKQESDYYNYHRHTVANFLSESKAKGAGPTLKERTAWARMNMSPNDIADVSGAVYTYLLNGHAPRSNWTELFRPGERVRLRFINGSSMTFFDVRIPGLPLTVIQADGNDVEPVEVDEFRMGVAETYDVIVQPHDETAYTIFAQAEDRTGFARGTLTPRLGLTATVPPMDPRPKRTMMDMGMDMSSMKGMDMSDMKGMDMAGMQGMQMGEPGMPESHANGTAAMPSRPNGNGSMPGMSMSGGVGMTPFPQPGRQTAPAVPATTAASQDVKPEPSSPVKIHTGPQVATKPMMVMSRLNEPGDGFQNNGRRVLTYADLRARYRGVDRRPPTREIELHLTGNMERFIWGFNGQKFSSAEPIELKLGERVRVVLINDTMMEHPIHLHGLWSELENGHGPFNPYKHTILVKPSERVSYLVSADTPGRWAYHCHLVFHMHAGMFRTVVVS
ncbi:MAG TPA: copper resistance system multicopper oxidase [Terracidiphilus sp.]|jgi:CopA family copper-resistance protein|nr:copper resistance system multicopper oxidase [Terracidiphilus sp.]